ncbi:MAG: hypothetical protein V4690_01680 [Patescibacteria group bacterium]
MLSYVLVLIVTAVLFMFWDKRADKAGTTPKFMWVFLATIIALPVASPFFFEFGDTKYGVETLLSFDDEKHEAKSHPFALWDPPFGNKKWARIRNQYICETEGTSAQLKGVGDQLYRFSVERTTRNVVAVVNIESSVCIADAWAYYRGVHEVGMNTDDSRVVRDNLTRIANWISSRGLLDVEKKLPEFRSLIHLTTSDCLIEAGSLTTDACLQIEDEVKKLLTPFVDTPGLQVEAKVSLKHIGVS